MKAIGEISSNFVMNFVTNFWKPYIFRMYGAFVRGFESPYLHE